MVQPHGLLHTEGIHDVFYRRVRPTRRTGRRFRRPGRTRQRLEDQEAEEESRWTCQRTIAIYRLASAGDHPVNRGYSGPQEGIIRLPPRSISRPCRIPSAASRRYARQMTQRHVRARGRSAEESALNGWLESDSHFIDLSPVPASLHSSAVSREPEGVSDSVHAVTRMGHHPRERV